MLAYLHYFNKLRKHLGFKNALNAFSAIKITRTGSIKLNFLKYPFVIRLDRMADSSTFNEVILRKEYDINLPITPMRIIDGGANIGLTSVFFANKYPDAGIVAVEPDSGNFALLKENIRHYSNITPLKTAVWSRKTNLMIVDHGRGDNSYMVEETELNNDFTFHGTSVMDMMRQQQWDTIDVLKLDIEGSEREVFSRNYEEWLPATKVLIVETHDRFTKGCSKAVFAAISRYDFSCRIKGFNFIFTNNEPVIPVKTTAVYETLAMSN